MTPRKLFVEQLLPLLLEFLEGYDTREVGLGNDIRRAANVAGILLNFPEYIYRDEACLSVRSNYESARAYRERHAWVDEPSYEIICDFANAWKHRDISRDRKRLQGMEKVQEAYAICKYSDEDGSYFRTRKLVLLEDADGMEFDIRRIIVAASKYWAKELECLAITPATPVNHFLFSEYISRDDEKQAGPLNVHCLQHEPFRMEPRLLEFDPISKLLNRLVPEPGQKLTPNLIFTVHPTPFTNFR